MIDKAILDEVLPVPELETLKEEKIAELKEEGFAITNFHSGGVFYTLLLISHNGKKWTSDSDGNVWEPGVYGWTEYVEPAAASEAAQEPAGDPDGEPGE